MHFFSSSGSTYRYCASETPLWSQTGLILRGEKQLMSACMHASMCHRLLLLQAAGTAGAQQEQAQNNVIQNSTFRLTSGLTSCDNTSTSKRSAFLHFSIPAFLHNAATATPRERPMKRPSIVSEVKTDQAADTNSSVSKPNTRRRQQKQAAKAGSKSTQQQ